MSMSTLRQQTSTPVLHLYLYRRFSSRVGGSLPISLVVGEKQNETVNLSNGTPTSTVTEMDHGCCGISIERRKRQAHPQFLAR